ncbi:MAG: PAS-domain containing protein [Gammaproteobacteria bacterium]|nr:PAS-domain containing protein [Gammaproteobacteria bacterium]
MEQDKRYTDRGAQRDRVSGGESASGSGDASPAAREDELVERVRALEAERDTLVRELGALRAQQPLLDALGSIVEAIVIYDADGRLVVCNENFRKLYGYSEDEARPGVHFSELGRIDVERGNVAVGDEYGDGEAYLARKAEYRRKLEGSFIVRLRDGRWIKTIDRPVRGGGFASIRWTSPRSRRWRRTCATWPSTTP